VILHTSRIAPHLFIEPPAALHTKVLRHGDLHAVDVVAIPNRFEERIGEAEVKEILHRLFAKEVGRSERWRLGKELAEQAVKGQRRGESRPKGFSMTTRASSGAAAFRQPFDYGLEERLRDGDGSAVARAASPSTSCSCSKVAGLAVIAPSM